MNVLAWANCVVYPVVRGSAKAYGSRVGKRTAPTPFLYRKLRIIYFCADSEVFNRQKSFILNV